jgi:hypothetical protein
VSATVFAGTVTIAALNANVAAEQQPTAAPATILPPAADAAGERQLLEKYCFGCHSERARASGLDSARKLSIESLDTANVARDGGRGSWSHASCARE